MTLLDKNEKAWKQRNKALLEQLYSITIDNNIITAETEKQEKIFGIQMTNRVWYLNSRLDPEAAAGCKAVPAADLRDLFCVWIVGWTTHPGTAWAV